MNNRVVVLHSEDPIAFVADCCDALADAVNEPHLRTSADDELTASYAALVRAYAALLRPANGGDVRTNVLDHLLDRLAQAERGEIAIPVVDIVDRLHGELASEPALS